MSLRTLVTGGAGFIGSELVRQLVAQGDRVTVLDDLSTGSRRNLEGVAARLVEGDVRDGALIGELLDAGVDRIFHLACLGVRHSIHSPLANNQVNADATLLLLHQARDRALERIVVVSSSEVYGSARRVPIDEEHPCFPHTVYGSSKLAGECHARAYHDTYGLPTVVVRPFNAFGPRCHHEGDSGEVIPRFLLAAMAGRPLVVFGEGDQTRDFTHVRDTAAGILRAGEVEDAVGQTLNLGSGRETSIRSLAATIASVVGGEVEIEHAPPRPGDVRRLLADSSRARALLGWSPVVSLTQGLEELHRWYRESARDPAELCDEMIARNWEKDYGEEQA